VKGACLHPLALSLFVKIVVALSTGALRNRVFLHILAFNSVALRLGLRLPVSGFGLAVGVRKREKVNK